MTGYIKNSAHLNGYPFADESSFDVSTVNFVVFQYNDSASLIDSIMVENVLYDSIRVSMYTSGSIGITQANVGYKRNTRVLGRDALELVIEPVFLGAGDSLIVQLDSRGDTGWNGSTALPSIIGIVRVCGKHGV